MNEAKQSVLMTMALLGETNAERSAYENVENGKQAWDDLLAEGLIVKNDFFVLSYSGKQKVKELHKKYGSTQRHL